MDARSPDGAPSEKARRLTDIYDAALPEVYRYLRARCGSTTLAEDLTSSVFVQAALSINRGERSAITTGWLITVARNRLIDHWRRQAVAERSLTLLAGGVDGRPDEPAGIDTVDWDVILDQTRAHSVLDELPVHYRSALTLRYLDDLPVPQCAEILGRSVRATESLLARARADFRATYERTGGCDD